MSNSVTSKCPYEHALCSGTRPPLSFGSVIICKINKFLISDEFVVCGERKLIYVWSQSSPHYISRDSQEIVFLFITLIVLHGLRNYETRKKPSKL